MNDTELVRVMFTADLDRSRLTEWLEANFKNEDVEITDRYSGDVLATHGDDLLEPYLCPECGRGAVGILTTGGEKVFDHGLDDQCRATSDK